MTNHESNQEQETERLIAQNLLIMENEMVEVLLQESIGGNAGRLEIDGQKYPLACANGFVETATGLIMEFGNHIQPKTRKPVSAIKILVACDLKGKHKAIFFKIVKILYSADLSIDVRNPISRAGHAYNQKYNQLKDS